MFALLNKGWQSIPCIWKLFVPKYGSGTVSKLGPEAAGEEILKVVSEVKEAVTLVYPKET